MTEVPVLQVSNLKIEYQTQRGPVRAARDVSFQIRPGQSLGLVGESGSGKTTIALALMGLLPENGSVIDGEVWLDGANLTHLGEREMQKYRWKSISMVFQAAMNSFNPLYKVRDQIIEAIQAHEDISVREAALRVAELFRMVGLDEGVISRYPHEYSGGMRQRAVIAQALACSPKLVIADEPTTALDVVVQDRILKELRRIQASNRMAMIYISHDIGVIAEMSDQVGVMYGGTLVELGPALEVLGRPRHPYTSALMATVPSVLGEKAPLKTIPGDPPDLITLGPGCPFAPRCPRATSRCVSEAPPVAVENGRWVRCWDPLGGGSN